MKIKVNEATKLQIDWAVAKCEGENLDYWMERFTGTADRRALLTAYSSSWQRGGPIIEREKISVLWSSKTIEWGAAYPHYAPLFYEGPTPLIAAMRCYVASKLGDEVDVPEELA
jgi:hypothetical protein